MLTVLTNLTLDVYMWTCTIWMTLFAASRKLRGDCEQVFINQLNFRPTSTGKHNSMGHLLPCAIDFKTNHPPIHLQWIWDTRHGNWAAPCYFNGASPTGSARWGYCLQRHLACEGLYDDDDDDDDGDGVAYILIDKEVMCDVSMIGHVAGSHWWDYYTIWYVAKSLQQLILISGTRYCSWPLVWGIHRWPIPGGFPSQRIALMFCLMLA